MAGDVLISSYQYQVLLKSILWNSPRDTARRRSLIARSGTLVVLQMICSQERPLYGGILLCKVNEEKTAQQKYINHSPTPFSPPRLIPSCPLPIPTPFPPAISNCSLPHHQLIKQGWIHIGRSYWRNSIAICLLWSKTQLKKQDTSMDYPLWYGRCITFIFNVNIRIHKQSGSDTISCSTHSCGFPIISPRHGKSINVSYVHYTLLQSSSRWTC